MRGEVFYVRSRQVSAWFEAEEGPDWLFGGLHGKPYKVRMEAKAPAQADLTLTGLREVEEVTRGQVTQEVKSTSRGIEYTGKRGIVCSVPRGAVISACKPSDGPSKKVTSVFVTNVVFDGFRLGQLRIFTVPEHPGEFRIRLTPYSSNGRLNVGRDTSGLYVVS